MILSAAISHVGLVRTENQDRVYRHPELAMFVVADGMGGQSCGSRASELTVDAIKKFFDLDTLQQQELSQTFGYNGEIGPSENLLITALGLANREVRQVAADFAECSGMGATVVAAYIAEPIVTLAAVGDCRAYLLRSGMFTQITTDDTVVQQLVKDGKITPAQAQTHPLRNQVTGAIGAAESVEIQTFVFDLQSADRLLLCSDGVHGLVTDVQIQEEIGNNRPLPEALEGLISRVIESGAPDNSSCILLEYSVED
jgi:PPM family protein phosphatase